VDLRLISACLSDESPAPSDPTPRNPPLPHTSPAKTQQRLVGICRLPHRFIRQYNSPNAALNPPATAQSHTPDTPSAPDRRSCKEGSTPAHPARIRNCSPRANRVARHAVRQPPHAGVFRRRAPENRVHAKSIAPQNRCTGLTCLETAPKLGEHPRCLQQYRQKRCAYSPS